MRIFLIFFVVVLGLGAPLSEVVKDIEVSGEARYRFEYSSSKKEQRKQTKIPFNSPKMQPLK